MNKVHIAGTGITAAFLASGINLFFPHAHLTADQMTWLVGVLPGVAMGLMAGIEAVFPKTVPVITSVEKAAAVA